MFHYGKLYGGKDSSRLIQKDKEGAVQKSNGFFGCGAGGVFNCFSDNAFDQRCADGSAGNGNDIETGMFCSDNGNRSDDKSAEHQCVAVVDSRHSSCGHSMHHAHSVFSGISEVQSIAGKAGQAQPDNERKTGRDAGDKGVHHREEGRGQIR